MEPVEVTARFDLDGKIQPLDFSWRQKSYKVAAVGRSWEDEAGRHVLVMTPGDRIFELIFTPVENRWYLRRPEGDRTPA
jgi:hypothetical protein